MNEIFKVSSQSSNEVGAIKDAKWKVSTKKPGVLDVGNQLDFHMSTSDNYLLIFAFLASRNPTTLDASLVDSIGGSDTQKRKRK